MQTEMDCALSCLLNMHKLEEFNKTKIFRSTPCKVTKLSSNS